MAAKDGQKQTGGAATQPMMPAVTLPEKAAENAGSSERNPAIVNELTGEITALRREVRLLRIANAELERVAVRDTLTPLYNRRYFLTALHERLGRAKRYQTKAAVLFIDLNRMKHINDLYGHSAGDFALVHTAQIVQANIRTTDVAARIGGDEFAIIIEEVDQGQAEAKANHLDRVLRASQCVYGDAILPVSASVGFTILRPNDTEDALIERADANMYARKRAWHERTEVDRSNGAAAA